jgi:oligopeptidase A
MNPLLTTRCGRRAAGLRAIRPEHVTPALDLLLAEAEAALAHAVGPDVPADYDALSLVLDVPVERLRTAWGRSATAGGGRHAALRAAYADNLPRVIDFSTRLGSDERLYAKYKAVACSPAAAR